MLNNNLNILLNRITKAIKTLSLLPNEQIEYLKELGTYPCNEELVLEFYDTYDAFIYLLLEYKISKDELFLIDKLKQLDYCLSILSDRKSEIWNIKSLNNDDWNNIRKLSLEVLELLKNKINEKSI